MRIGVVISPLGGYAAAGIAHVQVVFEPMSVGALETFAPVVAALRDA